MNTHPRSGEEPSFVGPLVSLLALLLVLALFSSFSIVEVLFQVAVSGVILYTTYSLYGWHPRINPFYVVGVLGVLSNSLSYSTASVALDVSALILNAAFFIYCVVLIIRRLFRTRRVSLNIILGAVCIYLLLGIIWAYAYTIIDILIPNSFHLPLQMAGPTQTTTAIMTLANSFGYYSLCTLTTVGYGDIYPISAPARYFSALEAICGQIYMGVLLARLVGMHISQK